MKNIDCNFYQPEMEVEWKTKSENHVKPPGQFTIERLKAA